MTETLVRPVEAVIPVEPGYEEMTPGIVESTKGRDALADPEAMRRSYALHGKLCLS